MESRVEQDKRNKLGKGYIRVYTGGYDIAVLDEADIAIQCSSVQNTVLTT